MATYATLMKNYYISVMQSLLGLAKFLSSEIFWLYGNCVPFYVHVCVYISISYLVHAFDCIALYICMVE